MSNVNATEYRTHGSVTTFVYDEAAGRIAFNVQAGDVTVCVRLDGREMVVMARDLGLEAPTGRDRAGATVAWWDFESGTDEPTVCLYRDDHFSVTLPHACGLDLLAALRERLGEGVPAAR
jgi:hypothetical protein